MDMIQTVENDSHIPVHRCIAENLQPDGFGMSGWTSAERGIQMAELILEYKPEVCVEIGVFGGRSLVAQALALRHNGKGKIFGIDPWKREACMEGESDANKRWWAKNVNLNDIHTGCMEAIWRLNLDEWAIIVRCASQHIASWFPMIGVAVIDGNHSEVASCRDVELYVPRIVPGGFLWMDDTDWASTRRAVALVNAQCELVRDYGSYRLYQKR